MWKQEAFLFKLLFFFFLPLCLPSKTLNEPNARPKDASLRGVLKSLAELLEQLMEIILEGE